MILRLVLILAALCSTAPAWGTGTQLDSDDFNRADTGGTQVEQLGAKWTTNTSTKFFKIVSNAVKTIDTANDTMERNTNISWPADHCSKLTLTTVSTSGLGTGYGVSVRTDTGGAHTGYRLVGATGGFELCRLVNGSCSAGGGGSIVSGAGTTFANGDSIELCAQGIGATIMFTMKKSDVEFSAGTTDSNAARLTTGSPGIAYSSTTGSTINADTWIGSSLAAGSQRGSMLFMFP